MLFSVSSDPHTSNMQVEQVPDAEFFAVEQALLAAGRQPAACPRPKTCTTAVVKKQPASVTSSRRSSATLQSGPSISDGKKRKLPPSFAQQQQTHKAQAVQQGLQCKGPIIYAYTAIEVDYHCTQLLKQGPQAVGFDIEWRVTYKPGEVRKTALMQLCSRSQHGQYKCLLLHIAHTGLTPSLIEVLESQDIHKLGVGITGDAHKLQRDFGVQCNGLVCLSEEASMRLTKEQMPETRGLAGLCQELLHLTLDKTNDVRCSNWETLPLSVVQKAYAATDAYAALAVYQVLQSMPVIAAPPRAAETALAPWPASPEEEAVLIVPAQQELLPLQPSKLAVYKLFIEQGLSMEAIASQRAVQLSTVQSYIAEAMAAGYTYPWHRMKVPFFMLASLCGHLRAYHKQQQLLSDAPLLQK
ncbi:hypothetical protein ABBQ38_000374 [Trebouxia sp. C0009 RCD-2024]